MSSRTNTVRVTSTDAEPTNKPTIPYQTRSLPVGSIISGMLKIGAAPKKIICKPFRRRWQTSLGSASGR
jgi:hypothetical protein